MKIGLGTQIIILAVILIGALQSCKKDWLDVKADKQQAVPETLSDFQKILDNSFVMNYISPALGEVASDGHYTPESAWPSLSDKEVNGYTWSHVRPYMALSDWDNSFTRVYSCNLVLEGLNKLLNKNNTDLSEWNNLKGQALFHRAITYYDLASVFSPPYNSSTASSDLGLPIRLESDVNILSKRNSVKQTYDQILNDLKDAQYILNDISENKTRPSKTAVFALLARVYLSIGNYDSAFAYANKCLALYSYLNDFNTFISASSNYIGNYLENKEVIFHNLFSSTFKTLNSNCLIDQALYSLYSSNDLRKTKYFRENTNGTISFKGNYSNSASQIFSGLATDEVFLIRAECYARKSNKDAAIADLNYLLRTRYSSGSFVDLSASDLDEALNLILIERRKELVLRGVRWTDLRRLNEDDRFRVTLKRVIGGNTYTLEPGSYKYTMPIPDDIIQMSNMQQNVGW